MYISVRHNIMEMYERTPPYADIQTTGRVFQNEKHTAIVTNFACSDCFSAGLYVIRISLQREDTLHYAIPRGIDISGKKKISERKKMGNFGVSKTFLNVFLKKKLVFRPVVRFLNYHIAMR